MLTRKMCVCAALTVLLCATAGWSITFRQPWDGPIVFHTTGWNSGTIWQGQPGTYTDMSQLSSTPAPGVYAGEDSWGLIRVDSILKGKVEGNKIIADPSGEHLWVHGDNGQELVAMFYGTQDIAVEITPSGSQILEGKGLQFDLYAQDHGTFYGAFNGAMDGSSARVDQNKYAGVGYDAAGNPLANASLWLSGVGQNGLLGPVAFPDTEIVSNFSPAVAEDAVSGDGKVYLSLQATMSGTGSANAKYDSDFFVGPNASADVSLIFSTKMNNPTNTVGANGGYDWTVTLSDDAAMIPEPATMVLLGGGLLALLRRRR